MSFNPTDDHMMVFQRYYDNLVSASPRPDRGTSTSSEVSTTTLRQGSDDSQSGFTLRQRSDDSDTNSFSRFDSYDSSMSDITSISGMSSMSDMTSIAESTVSDEDNTTQGSDESDTDSYLTDDDSYSLYNGLYFMAFEMKRRLSTIPLEMGEFLSIEVSGELGGHFSKSKKTLGTSPNNMGRYFRIHVKTNIDKLQLQSYVIYRKFKDVLTLYDSLAGQCPEGVTLPEKPDRRLFNKKQNKVQVERLLLSVASNPRLRTMDPVIDFLKPDCLPLEETPHTTPKTPQCNTPPSSDSVNNIGGERDHPNSAEAGESDKLAEFFTPDTSSGEAGTDHAPTPVHLANVTGNESPSLVRKTFRQLMMQKSEVEGAKEEEENPPIVIKEQERTVLLMMWSHEKEGYTVEGGEMEQLVEQLYSGDRPDADYVQTFLLGFKHFMKPEELMEMLIKKFESIQDEGDNMAVVKLRLSEVVAQWLERVWVDFHYSEVMCDKVDRFIQLVSSGHPQFLPVAMKLRTTKQKKQKEWELSLKDENLSSGSEPNSQCASPSESPDLSLRRANSDTRTGTLSKKTHNALSKLTINDLSHAQLARHLHVVDFEFMCKVELHEYLTHLWCKKDPQYQTLKKHLDDWINFWNRISLWVASEIIKEDTPKARATKIGTFVEVAKQLKQLFSYNMLHAFIVGFNHSSVRRLRKTWDVVASKHQNALSELEDMMSQDSNFSLYRKHRDKVPKTVCTIPLLSLFLKDLEFLNVGNPAKLKNGLWNFGKLRLLKKQISGLERYKLNKPNSIQTDDEIIKFCHQLSYLEGDLLYPMSLEKEPRDVPRVTRPLSVSSMSSVATSSSS